jgi:hypothetical protein
VHWGIARRIPVALGAALERARRRVLPTARAARPAAPPKPPRLPETSSLPVVHSCPGRAGSPRSRRMTKAEYSKRLQVLDGQGLRRGRIYDGAKAATAARSSCSARRPPCSRATTSRRRASTAHGRSPGPPISARRRSGAARPACKPASRSDKADRLNPRVPRESNRWTALNRGRRRCQARVRATQERVGAVSAPRPWAGSGAAARRPDDPRQARVSAQSGASRVARGLAAHSLR